MATKRKSSSGTKVRSRAKYSLNKRIKRTVSTPDYADPTIKARLKKLGVNFSEYCNALITFDCWAEKDHVYTGEATKGKRLDEERLWKEIIADLGKPEKTGGYFKHQVTKFLRAKLMSSHRTRLKASGSSLVKVDDARAIDDGHKTR